MLGISTRKGKSNPGFIRVRLPYLNNSNRQVDIKKEKAEQEMYPPDVHF